MRPNQFTFVHTSDIRRSATRLDAPCRVTGLIKPFIAFKTAIINLAVETATKNYTDNIDGIFNGDFRCNIPGETEVGDLLKKVGTFARARIYRSPAAEGVELAGRSVIKGLLSHFGQLRSLSADNFNALLSDDREKIKAQNLDFHGHLLRRLPKRYIEKYSILDRGDEQSRRAHLIIDFIAGMTDDFALETYQVLEGIRIK